jgi:hypothetical protein
MPPDGIWEPFKNSLTFSVANHVISAASITILAASVTAMQLIVGSTPFPFAGWLAEMRAGCMVCVIIAHSL